MVYGGSFAVTAVLAVGVGEVATVGVFCYCFRLWLLLIVQGLMCAESLAGLLLLLAFALSSSLALLSSCGGVMITGCFGVTAFLRGA